MVGEQGPMGRGFHEAPCFQLRQHKSGCLVLAPGTWGARCGDSVTLGLGGVQAELGSG